MQIVIINACFQFTQFPAMDHLMLIYPPPPTEVIRLNRLV